MPKRKVQIYYGYVNQIITVDSQETANVMLASKEWVLINTYRQEKILFFVLGRIGEPL